MLLAGLDPNGRDRRGLTPLMCQQHLECNRLLLEAGADLHATDLQGNSVLAYQAGALARVSAGVEYNDARRFEGWARQLMTGRDQPGA